MYLLQILLNSVVLGTQVLLIAVPLFLIFSVTRVFNLALGATTAVVAYAAYAGISGGWPLWATVVVTLLVACAFGAISFASLEPFVHRQQPLLGLLASFALGVIAESVVAILFGTDGKHFIEGVLPVWSVGGLQLTVPGVYTILIGLFFAALIFFFVRWTPGGRFIRGIAELPHVIQAFGLNQGWIRFLVFVVAAVFAGAVGVLVGLHTALGPFIGLNLIIMAFVALLVGGVQDLRGTIVAAYLVSLVPEFLVSVSVGDFSASPSWKMVFVFLVAVVALALRPHGLFAVRTREQ